ncbi:response regulator [Paenibacillus xylaniclasticus]|uniref:response regulator n=1 Tax=Paenibacillus xylaniclasticus TaxID=588083 RepID=UPI000FDA68FD|nr:MULTISPECIES: response regulator [Paenibacillus]GFN31372.1 DNA-binding response regulator [Paenibacillus curdlanolyticus]
MLKAVVVEDEHNLLDLLVYFLNHNEQYEVIGAFHNPEKALQEIPKLAPDVIFLDIEMPKMNGIELATRLKSDYYQLIFTTAYEQYALEALKLDASEYLLKPITPESIAIITPKIMKKDAMLKHFIASPPHNKEHRIECFGSLTVVTSAEQIVKWPTRKVEELFAYLLVHSGSVMNKWRLADDLWPNKGLNNIYNSVYLLNRTMKELNLPIQVINMNEGYTLEIGTSITIDLIQFNQLNPEDRSSTGTLHWANYISQRGPLFHNKDYSWLTLYREQYNMKHQLLLHNLLQYYQTKDSIIYEALLHDYQRMYED